MWPMSNDRGEGMRPQPPWLQEARDFAEVLALQAAERLRAAVLPAAVTPATESTGTGPARRTDSPALTIVEKAPGDWCSELDAAIEEQMRLAVAQRFPGHAFYGEEGQGATLARENGHPEQAHDGAAALNGERPVWVVDPIDGSMNFLRGYPQYAVSVAVVWQGEPVVGCIVDPVRQEVFTAAVGHGARCNGVALQVASTPGLSQAVAATVFPKPTAPFMERYMDEFNRAVRRCAGLRRSGSMALELAYLAAGRVDAFWERGMGAWDAAAGLLLIREAGGAVWSMDGRAWWDSASLAASTPGLKAAWAGLLEGNA